MDNYISDTYEKIESRIIDTNIVCSKISALLFSNNYVAENEYLEKIIFDITNIKNMYDMFTDNINSNIVRDVYFRMLIEWMVVGYTDDPITAYSVDNICASVESDINDVVDQIPNIFEYAIYGAK